MFTLNGKELTGDWIQADEAAQRLGVTKDTVLRWIREGKAESEKIGNTYIIKLDSLPAGRMTIGEISRATIEQLSKKAV